jgi:membrane fusion protein, multidrug efflux system
VGARSPRAHCLPRSVQRRSAAALLLATALLGACQDKPAASPAARGAGGSRRGHGDRAGCAAGAAAARPAERQPGGRDPAAGRRPGAQAPVHRRLAVVAAGQPLYQLDAASLEAERARSAAALQKAQAQLVSARAKVARDAELLRAEFLSPAAADDSTAALRQAEADVAVARAALDAAQVQLRVRASWRRSAAASRSPP